MTTTMDTRVKVPDELIARIGTKIGNSIITGFAEMPTKHTPEKYYYYGFGVEDKGVYTKHDIEAWKHAQRMRNQGVPNFGNPGRLFKQKFSIQRRYVEQVH